MLDRVLNLTEFCPLEIKNRILVSFLGAGMVGGLPSTGATMRTVATVRSAGDSPLSGAVHTVVFAFHSFGFGGFIRNIPLTVLSAIITSDSGSTRNHD